MTAFRLRRAPWGPRSYVPGVQAIAGGPDQELLLAELAALRRTARALTGRQDEADDLVQAVFERALPRWHRIDGPPRGYLTRILVNLYRDQARRSRRLGAVPLPIEPATRDEAGDLARRLDMDHALAGLPPRTRAIVVLRYLEDLPAADVGRIVGLPAGSVRRIAAAALATLRPLLAPSEEPVQESG